MFAETGATVTGVCSGHQTKVPEGRTDVLGVAFRPGVFRPLHEVTERLAAGAVVDWAALAHELGDADQAHFARDFRMIFGESPTWYAERY